MDSDPAKAGETAVWPSEWPWPRLFIFFKPKSNSHGNLDGAGGVLPVSGKKVKLKTPALTQLWKEQPSGQMRAFHLSLPGVACPSFCGEQVGTDLSRPDGPRTRGKGCGWDPEEKEASPRALRKWGDRTGGGDPGSGSRRPEGAMHPGTGRREGRLRRVGVGRPGMPGTLHTGALEHVLLQQDARMRPEPGALFAVASPRPILSVGAEGRSQLWRSCGHPRGSASASVY